MHKFLNFIFVFFCVNVAQGQSHPISEATEISILTMGPGNDLAEKFGHSAFRIQDPINGIDEVYNYGVYDFEAPNFILNFAKGKLLYLLDTGSYGAYENHYKRQGRWMKEQVIDLNREETLAIASYLQNNAKPENSRYLYDFFYDNCATKMRDVLQLSLGDNLTYNDASVPVQFTFRELIQSRLDFNTWGSLGIDVALGSVIDREATPLQHQFLPDYVYAGAKEATITRDGNTIPLIREKKVLLTSPVKTNNSNLLWSPLIVFGIIGILILFVTYNDNKKNKRSRFLDFTLLFVTGIVGILLVLLWTATDHTATANNYNLLWAFPLNVILAFVAIKKNPPNWFSRYIFLLLIFFSLLTLHWFTGVQVFAPVLIPLFIALVVRYFYVWRFLK